jgi:hypothetical protein
LVLFHTGLSKLLYGQYFHGDFLAYMIGTGDRFGDAFRLLLGADEVVRLQGYDALRTGAGPFRVSSWPFVLASNLVWIAELALPVLLMIRRTRAPAALASIALVLAIQAGARELGFAMLFGNLLLLFLPGVWNRRLLPLCALAFVLALLAVLGWLPGGGWLEAGYL